MDDLCPKRLDPWHESANLVIPEAEMDLPIWHRVACELIYLLDR
jgi:hypothetical protein